MLRHPRLSDSYDWIVLGDSPAALLSAALVSRMGLSVLVVGDGSEKKWKLSSTGQVVDPESSFISGIGHPASRLGLAGLCLADLRMADSEWDVLIRDEQLFQGLTPRFRVGFGSELEFTRREWVREGGGRFAAFEEFLDALSSGASPIRSYWEGLPGRLTFPLESIQAELSSGESEKKGKAEQKPTSLSMKTETQVFRELDKELLRGGSGVFWGRSDVNLSEMDLPSSVKELLEAWTAGALASEVPSRVSAQALLQTAILSSDGGRCRGGMSALRATLANLASRHGAHLLDSSISVGRFFMDEGRVVGVQLSGGDSARNLTRARGVLSCRHPEKVLSWMSQDDLSALSYPSDCELLRITLALTVHAKAIPVGLSNRSIWREDGAPSVEIEVASPQEYGFSERDQRYIFVRSYFPRSSTEWTVNRWRTVCQRLFRQVSEVIPFLETHLVRAFPDFRSDSFEAHWSELYGDEHLEDSEILRVPIAVPSKPYLPQVEGLFHSHRCFSPMMGFMGEFVSAINATAWIAHRSGISGPLG